ncbi:unnamed protein product [Pleuronectes platessa]|uniref:Uncharacterized protein n=1 Tax=Pleuronectes platessa TaxID=8262 RepID=A0A9N7U9B6_PLEPL|nr:unnamed protein product [Pleuronectes platessa]
MPDKYSTLHAMLTDQLIRDATLYLCMVKQLLCGVSWDEGEEVPPPIHSVPIALWCFANGGFSKKDREHFPAEEIVSLFTLRLTTPHFKTNTPTGTQMGADGLHLVKLRSGGSQRPCSDLTSASVMGDPIKGGQLQNSLVRLLCISVPTSGFISLPMNWQLHSCANNYPFSPLCLFHLALPRVRCCVVTLLTVIVAAAIHAVPLAE